MIENGNGNTLTDTIDDCCEYPEYERKLIIISFIFAIQQHILVIDF